jgi:hypothetical protein
VHVSKRYPRRWVTAWFALACPVILAALVVWSAAGVAVLLVLAFGITTALLFGVNTPLGTSPFAGGVAHVRRTLAAAARWAVIEVGVAVTAIGAPLVAVLVVLAMVATAPWAIRRFSRRGSQVRPAAAGSSTWLHAQEVDELSPERIRSLVRRLDVSGLCRAWRSSHALLGQVRDVEAHSKVVWLRQEYLDEMERRDAAGFQRWLEADAQAVPAARCRPAGPARALQVVDG